MNKLKKEINKEAMFNKIMPSGTLDHTVAPNVKNNNSKYNSVLEDDRDERAAAAIAQRDMILGEEDISVEAPDKNPDEKKDETPSAEALTTRIVNIHAKMIDMKIDEAMEKFNCCTCSECRKYVLCNSLNNIPPKYVAVTGNDIDKIIEKEDFNEIINAIMKAILDLKKNPIH